MIKKFIILSIVMSMLLTACSGVDMNIGTENGSGQNTAETENGEDFGVKGAQSLASSYTDVGGIIGEQKIVNYYPIPEICQWDGASKSFIAPDNGTNENGESIMIQVKCQSIDKSEKYADNLARIEGMLNENKDKYSASGFSYVGEPGYEVIAYYYATEEVLERDGKEYVHTVGVFELLRYTREQCIDPYTATTFTVDVVKPAEVEKKSVYAYFSELFSAVEMGYTDTK